MPLLTKAQARAFDQADIGGLIPQGEYKVKIVTIDPLENEPERFCFKLKIMSGDYVGRTVKAWASTTPDKIWTLKKLIGEVVIDAASLELDDLEGHIFTAHVTHRKRTDTGDLVTDVQKLTEWSSGSESESEAAEDDGDGLPF